MCRTNIFQTVSLRRESWPVRRCAKLERERACAEERAAMLIRENEDLRRQLAAATGEAVVGHLLNVHSRPFTPHFSSVSYKQALRLGAAPADRHQP